MNQFKRYNSILITCVVILGSILVYFSLSTQPYVGDLTRLGGYAEKSYGWNATQASFKKPLFRYSRNWKDYDQYYDVLVLGDSFSKDKKHSWQNFLANNTGLSIFTIHVDNFKLHELLKHPQFIKSPPAIVVYESVERMLIPRLVREQANEPGEVASLKPKQHLIPIQPLNIKTLQEKRKTKADFMQRLNVTSDLLNKFLVRDVLGLDLFKVALRDLQRPLFSSANSEQLIFLKNHLMSGSLSLHKTKAALKGAGNIKNALQSNKHTVFYMLVFPNRISAYRDELADKAIDVVSFYDHAEAFEPFNLVPLYDALTASIKQGTIDVYLSDDTHTSALGYEIAASELQARLQRDAVLQ